jgi:glycosyltransferase involved in cell wall biosynthesis
MAQNLAWHLHVFYCWDFGIQQHKDPGFGVSFQWDIPLLEGYEYSLLDNVSRQPGSDHFFGIDVPGLASAIDGFAPDAVLMIGYNYRSFLELLIRVGRRRPFILRGDSHRLVRRRGLLAAVRRYAIAAVFRRFRAFLYVGSANRAYYREHGVSDDRLFFAPHSVDNSRFIAGAGYAADESREFRAMLGIPDRHRVILFAGKFEDTKRPLDLLEAFNAANLGDATLLFVGSGPLEAELKRRASSAHDVRFAPFQNQTLMPRTYAAADVFVLPSVGETWGLAVNEAMCSGLPIIVSSHVGCAEDLVRSGVNGLVFPAGSVSGLSEALQFALSDDERLRVWGRASSEIVSKYSYANATRGLIDAVRFVTRCG